MFLGVLAWGWCQVLPGAPTYPAHPVWSIVPEATAYMSADPGQGRHALMRLACYAVIFLATLSTCCKTECASLVLKIIAIYSTAFALFALYAFATGKNIIPGEDASGAIVQASFINRNSYATYAVFGVLANLAAYFQYAPRHDYNLRGRLEQFFSGRGSLLLAL